MGPDRRDGAVGQAQGRRIPIPPPATPAESTKGQQLPSAKSGIPSPRRRSAGGFGRGKDVTSAAILSTSTSSSKRLSQPPVLKMSKSLLRPSTQPYEEKDDVRQRDNGQRDCVKKDSNQRDKALKDSGPRRPALTDALNITDASKRVLKQPSLLLKSSVAACSVTSASVCPSKAAPALASAKPLPRSESTSRDRLSNDTRTSMMRRSMSVGKGRASVPQQEQLPQQAGARSRPAIERTTSTSGAGAPYRHTADRRDASALRPRPSSTSGKMDMSLPTNSKLLLTTITEAPARPTAQTHGTTSSVQTKPAAPSRPAFSLNLAALKPQPVAPVPPLPPVEPCASPVPEDSGPPVPKLDLGGILQRRAEEQASEPVFMVAADTADAEQLSASASQPSQQDKRKSGSRQPSAKEEPAEHFYLYPKVKPQEKKRIDDICRVMPKRQQVAVTDLFGKMVEARQNCEQMCFRGHRLLDQAQTEFRSRLAQKEEEVAQTKEEAAQWRHEAEFLRSQLALLLGARQPEECADDSAAQGQKEQEGSDEERAAYLRSSLLSTFDSMAQLGAGVPVEAFGGDGQGDADG